MVLLAAASAHADVVAFNTMGPGDSFDVDGPAQQIIGSNIRHVGAWTWGGMAFTPTVTGTLSSLTMGLNRYYSNTNDVQFFISEESGGMPGAVLESFTLNNAPRYGRPGDTVATTITSVTNPLLNAGTTYFVYGESHLAQTFLWYDGATGTTGTLYERSQNDQGYDQAAVRAGVQRSLRVNVTPTAAAVPEPGSLALFAMGGIPLLGILRRRRC